MRLLWWIFLPACAYQCVAIIAAISHLIRRWKRKGRGCAPPDSEGTRRAIGWRAQCRDRLARVLQTRKGHGCAPPDSEGTRRAIGWRAQNRARLARLPQNRTQDPVFQPGVSVLKPLRGLDPNTREAFVSQARQDYTNFEILFGVRDDNDPAAFEVRRMQKEFPDCNIRLVVGSQPAANGKVGVLMELAQHAQYPIWVVNDSDIRVNPSYLFEVVAPLSDRAVGVVTCLYRAHAHTVPAAWEALGIATDFMPSTLVAQFLGVTEFGLGSTLAFRAADLQRVGGFDAIADYLADDYQLAKRITSLGKRALLSTYTVETALNEASWRGAWNHQLRWARTIRFSKGAGYLGLPITHAGLWCGIALAFGAWIPAMILVALRVISAFIAGAFILRARLATVLFWLAPFWDLYAFCVWLTSYAGRTVRWRDRILKISSDGRIRT